MNTNKLSENQKGNFNRASKVAFADISKYLKENYDNIIIRIDNHDIDVWVVTPRLINNKLSRRLNKELGINKTNYTGTKTVTNK